MLSLPILHLQAFDADAQDTAETQEHFLSIADVSCEHVDILCHLLLNSAILTYLICIRIACGAHIVILQCFITV